jgi:c-di-GMP-binding flagellar brake protein YcgR
MMARGGSQPVDRRASGRIDVRVPINVNPTNASFVISGRTEDLSLGGMRVRTEVTPPFKISDEIMFLVSEPYFEFQGLGEIIWNSSPKGRTLGIKFTQIEEEAKRSLEKFLKFFVHFPTG